jgi:hypothetical protein
VEVCTHARVPDGNFSKTLKIKIISKFTSSFFQCNTRTTGDSVQVMKCQINKMTMYAEQQTGVQEVVTILLKSAILTFTWKD